jgi:hypothetical protein
MSSTLDNAEDSVAARHHQVASVAEQAAFIKAPLAPRPDEEAYLQPGRLFDIPSGACSVKRFV